MKLLSIQLQNFRQFYGQTPKIELARGSENATIIHGNNGAGKTTLLNAFTWVLYEKFSSAFAAEDQLVNKRAISEVQPGNPVECWVEIAFEHDSKHYQVKRLCRAYKNQKTAENPSSELRMQVAGDDGRWWPPVQPPEDVIGRILPESLHQYFFFDGERIEQIVRPDKKAEIAAATKELLGVEVLTRSIRHLGEAKRALETDLETIGDPQTKKLLQEKQSLVKEIKKIDKRSQEIVREIAEQEELKKVINQQFLDMKGVEELQKLRGELETQQKSIRTQLKEAYVILRRSLASRGYAVLLSELTAQFASLVDSWREKGELPTGIKRQFGKQLLERQRCICGAKLEAGNDGHKLVQAWIDKEGPADIEESAIRISAHVEEMDKKVPEFWEEIDRQQGNINRFRTERLRIEAKLDEVNNQLRRYPNEDIQKLQKRLDENERLLGKLNQEKGANKQQIENMKSQIDRLDKEIDKHQMNEVRQSLAQKRIATSQDAIDRITEVRARLEKQFRSQLEKRVQDIFSQISFTPYFPKLNESYELTLVEDTAGLESIVAASTGENQILSLSFIGGIIDGVRQWSQKNTLMMGPDSSTFPIVMDSPFGSLDEIYRRQIAKTLPKLANQLVVLVTKTQWRGEVETEMGDRIGRHYVLAYNSPKPDCEEDSINLAGLSYPLVRKSPNRFEYTEIIEVENDQQW
ncbi:MAG: AAA family ATPase [Oscillatoria sp. SIO1A7]|nr:AAA family ATPase [Oscillatoria sp. SIO1A7]